MRGTAKPRADHTAGRERGPCEDHHLSDRPEATGAQVADLADASRGVPAVTGDVRVIALGHHVAAVGGGRNLECAVYVQGLQPATGTRLGDQAGHRSAELSIRDLADSVSAIRTTAGVPALTRPWAWMLRRKRIRAALGQSARQRLRPESNDPIADRRSPIDEEASEPNLEAVAPTDEAGVGRRRVAAGPRATIEATVESSERRAGCGREVKTGVSRDGLTLRAPSDARTGAESHRSLSRRHRQHEPPNQGHGTEATRTFSTRTADCRPAAVHNAPSVTNRWRSVAKSRRSAPCSDEWVRAAR